MKDPIARFHASTTYDEPAYRALVQVTMKHLRRWPRRMLILSGILSVLLPGAYMISQAKTPFIALLTVFIGNWMVIVGIFAPAIATRMLVASNRKGEAPVVRFAFGEGVVQVENRQKTRRYAYAEIQRVFEVMGYFVFFFKDKQVDLLKQQALTGGSLQEFRSFLNARLAGEGRNAS